MIDRSFEKSPRFYARVAGVLYVIVIAVGLVAEVFVKGRLIVSGDAGATAANIVAHLPLFRISAAAQVTELVCAVGIAGILYLLLRPVSSVVALLAMLLVMVSIAVEAVDRVSLFAATFFLNGSAYLKTFEPRQLDGLAYVALKVDGYGFGVSLIFFGFGLFLFGYLMFRSTYFPKTVGVLVMIAGASYLVNSYTLLAAPDYAAAIFPILALGFVGEATLCVWLIVRGVDVARWEARDSG